MSIHQPEAQLMTWPNGLRAVLLENHDTPVVACMIYVGVGSADETPEQAGLAHFFEHMIFKGTPKRPVGRIAAEIEGAGGDINAYTTFDHTCYYVSIASRYWLTGLDVLCDALGNASLDAEEFARERHVIYEEMKRADDTPAQIVGNNLLKLVFRAHPYRRPIIGFKRTLAKLSHEDMRAFFASYYTPSNMVAVVVGDFKTEEAHGLLDRTLGSAKSVPVKRPDRAAEPAKRRPRSLVEFSDVQEATFEIAYPAPRAGEPDAAALDVLALVLGSGDSSRLTQRVKRRRGLVHEAFAYNYNLRDHGMLAAGGVCFPRRTATALEAVLRETARFRRERVSAAELERARRNIEADFIFDRETPFGLAKKLGYSMMLFGDLNFEERYLASLATVDADSIVEAARNRLAGRNVSASVLVPRGTAGIDGASIQALLDTAAAEVDGKVRGKSTALPPMVPSADARDGARGRLRLATLDNGVRLIVKESTQAPVLSIRACLMAGSRFETPATAGMSRFVSQMLGRGTKTLDAPAFAEAVESLAGAISPFSGRNSMGLSAEFLARHLDKALALTADALLSPAFAEDEIELQRLEQIASIVRREDALERRCMDLFHEVLFTRHPYGLPMVGTVESVEAFSKASLTRFYRRVVRPENLVIALAGDVRFERVVALANEAFGAWSRSGAAVPQPKEEPAWTGARRASLVRDKEQAHLIIGFTGTRLSSPDRFAVEVLNAILSGQGGRLFMELRDRQHLAYSVSSFNQEGVEPGSLGIYIGTSHDKVDAARKGMWEVIERLHQEPVSDEELRDAKRYLIGSTQIDMAQLSSLALTMALDELLGLGYREPLRLAAKIERVTAKQVRDAARRYWRRDAHVEAVITNRPID